MSLLVVRCPPEWVSHLARNPAFRAIWPRIVRLDQDRWGTRKTAADHSYWDTPSAQDPQPTRDLIKAIIIREDVTHVVASQKLFWYSDLIEEVCAAEAVEITWVESFNGTLAVFDKSGLHYTKVNDLMHYEPLTAVLQCPMAPEVTREPQPDQRDIPNDGKTMCVFGQVPWDMSLFERPGQSYLVWLDALFRLNPDTRFLFKHHPLAETPGIRKHSNVTVVNEHIGSMMKLPCAAFSSTVIFEALMRGKPVLTGGYHLASGLMPTAHSEESLRGALETVRGFAFPMAAANRRVNFVLKHYRLSVESRSAAERVALSSDQFFLGD